MYEILEGKTDQQYDQLSPGDRDRGNYLGDFWRNLMGVFVYNTNIRLTNFLASR